MKKVTLFHLEDCPYCHHARRALKELVKENPAYGEIEVEWIEERRHPEIAARYNYYYVPTLFHGEDKLYEASPSESYSEIKENIRTALDRVMG